MRDEPFAPDDPYYDHYTLAAKSLLDGTQREVLLLRMLFGYRITVTDGPQGVFLENAYCFHVRELVWAAFEVWDGESRPVGWVKNPTTGMYSHECPCDYCKITERPPRP